MEINLKNFWGNLENVYQYLDNLWKREIWHRLVSADLTAQQNLETNKQKRIYLSTIGHLGLFKGSVLLIFVEEFFGKIRRIRMAKKIKVCKPFLMSSRNNKAHCTNYYSSLSGAKPDDNRGKYKQHSKLDNEIEELVHAYRNGTPRVQSHYLLNPTIWGLINGGMTVLEMHRNYKSLRQSAN